MSMESSPESISRLLREFKDGDREAANELTRRYFDRVVLAARNRLRHQGIRVVDGEDIAASVFESFLGRVDEYQGNETLSDQEQLWRLLCRLMRSKTVDALRRERAAKRGGGQVRGESVFMPLPDQRAAGIDHARGPDASPHDEVALSERYQQLIDSLGSELMREIITLRLEGCDVAEIAERVKLSPRSVRRKISIARSRWEELAGDDRVP